jgi:hypothetical protein
VYNVYIPGVELAKPGFMELELKRGTNLRVESEARAVALWKGFAAALEESPEAAKKYYDKQGLSLIRNLKELNRIRLEVRQVNEQVDQLLQKALFNTATVKFTAELGLNILGLTAGCGVLGFLARTGIGLGYPVAVELINNWDDAGLGTVSILAFAGAVKTNVSSFFGEETVMKKAELNIINEPLAKADAAAKEAHAAMRAAKGKAKTHAKGTPSPKAALKTANQKAPAIKQAAKVGLGRLGVALTGVSCYFAVSGSIQSGKDYQAMLEGL